MQLRFEKPKIVTVAREPGNEKGTIDDDPGKSYFVLSWTGDPVKPTSSGLLRAL
jgi:hypothetical protein